MAGEDRWVKNLIDRLAGVHPGREALSQTTPSYHRHSAFERSQLGLAAQHWEFSGATIVKRRGVPTPIGTISHWFTWHSRGHGSAPIYNLAFWGQARDRVLSVGYSLSIW